MLLNFSLSRAGLSRLDKLGIDELTSISNTFCKFWINYGVCIENSRVEGAESVPDLVRRTPQIFRKKFLTVYKRSRKIRVAAKRKLLLDCATISEVGDYCEYVQLYLVDGTERSDFGILPRALSSKSTDQEFCLFHYFQNAESYNTVVDNSSKKISAGEKTKSVWETYFKPHAICSDTVVIVDRYTISQHANATKNHQSSGVLNFLKWLYESKPNSNVTIICSIKGASSHAQNDFINDLKTERTKANAAPIDLHRIDDETFKKLQHYRYFRFENDVIYVDTGFEIFQGPTVYRVAPIKQMFGDKEECKRSEKELVNQSRARLVHVSI